MSNLVVGNIGRLLLKTANLTKYPLANFAAILFSAISQMCTMRIICFSFQMSITHSTPFLTFIGQKLQTALSARVCLLVNNIDSFSIRDNMFCSMKRRFRPLGGCFGSMYRQFRLMSGRFCSMKRPFQLTCLCCALKIHHNNEYWQTKGTLSLWRNHYGSHFLPFLAWRNHFGGGELLRHDKTI